MNSQILEVKNLTVEFGDEKIIDDLSFKVVAGEFLTILGPNGSGKTVLLRTLLGLIAGYGGEVIWRPGVKIGYLPQGLTQLKVKNLPLSVEEFLSLKGVEHGRIVEFLRLVGVNEKNVLKKRIGNLSGGQFQRMLLSWALLDEPEVLLFDEPTTGVDVGGEETVYGLLRKFWREKKLTILLITHDLNIVYKYSTDVLCMSRDNVCHARPKEVLSPEILKEIYDIPIKFYKHKH